MGVWIRESFDPWAVVADMQRGGAANGNWASAGGALGLKTPYGVGQSLYTNSIFGGILLDSGASAFASNATVYAGAWIMNDGAFGGSGAGSIQIGIARFTDGGTAQCSIWITDSGHIQLRSGASGTLISDAGLLVFGSQWEFYCFKVVINNTTGEFHVRKNWDTSDIFSATSLNTRGGTANNQANGVVLDSGGGSQIYIDDLAYWDGSGSGDWSSFMLPYRGIELMPITDNAVQYSQTNGGSTNFGTTTNTSTSARSTNIIYFQAFTPTCGGSLGNISLELNANMTGKLNVAIYDADGDVSAFPTSNSRPGNLVATCTELTNPTSGVNTFVPTTTPVVQNGRKYYIAVFGNASYTLKSDSSSITGWQYALTYAAFPSSVAGLGATLSSVSGTIHATITVSNAGLVNDKTTDAATLVFDSTVNDQDLYDTQDLPGSGISSVSGLDFFFEYNKDVAGTRTISGLLKSGATTKTFAAVTPTTTLAFSRFIQDTDPNTSAAWTTTAINAMLLGQKTVT